MKVTGTLQAGTGLWQSPNTGATNESGFTGLPAGSRYDNGMFLDFGYGGYWWSSSEDGTTNAWARDLNYLNGSAYSYYDSKTYGFSVRCLRD